MNALPPLEKLAALNREMMEILAPPGPMRAEMPRLMEIEDEMMSAKAEANKEEMRALLNSKKAA